MPRRRKVPKTKRLSAWLAKQEVERLADEQEAEITDQQPAVEQEVEVREEELSDEQEVEVTGQGPAVEQEVEVTGAWEGQDGQFMFNPLTADDQMHLAVLSRRQTRSMSRCCRQEGTEASEAASSKRKITLNDNNDDDRKKAKRERERKRYQEDETYAQAQRDRKKRRYHTDEDHAQAERDRKKERYHTDEDHAQAERDRKKERYHTDEDHAQAERDRKKERYHADEEHAQEKRDKTNERYHTDEDHAQEKRDREKDRYHTDPEQRDLKKRNVQINRERNQNLPDVNKAIEKFQVECKKGPEVEDNSEARTIPEHGEPVSEDGNGMVGTTEDGMEDDEMDNILQQPIDIGQEFLDHHDEHILCVAPGEGEKPVSVFQEVGGEAMSFPVQFPTGKFSFNDDRDVRITPSKYFKARLMGADTRFARDTSYIFFAQYVTELRFIQSNISISMRKGSPTTSDGRRISAGMLSNREDLQAILKSDQGYRFLQPVRGTPQFWDRALNELYAMIRQLGIPTWFATFSAADLRWPEVLEAIRQDDSTVPVSDLSWEERCDILKSNPVTAARMFDHRVKQFFKHVIKSPSQPIGEVVDTFTRTEFQQRGSPHIHCLFWVKDAPKLNVNSEEEICAFVDKYVSSQLPNPETDKELFDIVSQVQMHRKGHTTSCKKGGKVCRFGFPKPPVKQTFLCSPVALQDLTDEELASISEKKKQAEAVLKHFWDVLDKTNEPENCSTEDLLKEAKITTAQLCEALNLMATRKQVMLRRDPKDMWVNNYNPHLLRAWNANIDIQYVLDAYSCVRYIVSYISKAEREMGKLLKQAQKEAREGNEDVVTETKKVGTKYLHHREVSAQEAVYRVCSLKLKDCSRDVIFIPTDEHANRLSKPLAAIQQMASEGNSEDESIWMPSIMDRYKARPREEPFCSMCAAEFVSEYRVVSRSGTQDNGEQSSRGEVKHVLRDNLGAVQKRTRSKPAVIRFAKFNKAKEPERYYLTLLKLYLPHYNDAQLKPPQYEKYEEFYSDGFAPLPNTNNKVDDIVHANRRKFEQNVDEIEQARKDVEDGSFVEDVWAQIFPELEQERLECQNNAGNQVNEDEDTQDDIPDLAPTDRPKEKSFTLEACQTKVPSNVAIPMMQSLNPKQQEVFYFVRKWCMETAQGKRPDPFHIFLTGGAGTGKSHLIKCICYEATRLLQQTQENPDSVSVLLAAPTGTAAFNIGGSTIHHAFHLMCKSKDFQDLSESTVNAMRAQYESLKIVIVDEVSMVDKPLMKFIHLRLRQLRQGRPNALFGNVSILAVGDMYQVPPVKGISLYKERDRDISDLWNPNFEVVELEEIMRQKDDAAFAKLLNRMRVKRKKDKLSDEDDEVLSSRVLSVDFEADDYPKDALHIFSTNIAVAEHNDKMLRLRCPDVRCFEASDFVKDPTTGSMKRRDLARGGKDDLPDVVKVGVGARVMLSRNVNVADGLVNGAFGTVSGVAGGQDDAREVATVFVQFDNPKAGALERQKSAVPSSLPVNSVPVRQIEDNLNNKSKVKRNQIPLKLAWACTVHKVQGMTTDEVVVSMKKVFVSGMAYVALSRVRSIAGLHITDYEQGSIYCDEEVQGAISDMKHFKFVSNPFTNVQLESFNMFRKDRSGRRVCEDGSSATSNAPHGGVAVYVRDVYRCSEIPIPDDIGLERVETTSLSSDWDEGGKPQACPVIGTRVENHKFVRREVNHRAPPVIGEEGGQSSPRDWGGGRSELPPVIGEEAGNPVIGEEGGKPRNSPRNWGGERWIGEKRETPGYKTPMSGVETPVQGGQAVTWLEDPAQSIQQMGPLLGKEAELGPGETDRAGTSHQQKDTAHSICMIVSLNVRGFEDVMSWTYGGYDVNTTTESVPPSLTYFVHNDEWELLAIGDKHEDIFYVCCPEPYPLVTFTIYIRRRSMYYLIFLVSPCLLFSIMTILGFYLPPEAGERVGLGITVLLAFTVFLLMVSELMPPTSSAVPLIDEMTSTVFLLMVSELMPLMASAVPLNYCLYFFITVLLIFYMFLLMVCQLMPPTSSAVPLIVAFTVFLLMVSEVMPPTSSAVPLIVCYYGVTIMLVMFATFMTILILNLHHTDPSCRPLPPWVRRAFLHGLGRVFCTRPHQAKAPPGVDVSLSNCTELEFLCEEYENEIRVTDNGKNKNVEDAHAPDKRYVALLRALRMLMRELHLHVIKCQQMSAANESRDNDWKRVARVLDKLCVALFTFTTVVTAVAVLLKVPHINL
ncbi:hypothetical protein Bbelb_101110 [Branchiostoma belcheri]|nr:hypothetical protein Bbelb_101110 [Branchiostoma belcheri]